MSRPLDRSTRRSRGDAQTLLDALDDTIEWHEAGHITFVVFKSWTVSELMCNASLGAVAACFPRIAHRATVKATGKPLDAQVAHVWDFEDGKVVRWQQ